MLIQDLKAITKMAFNMVPVALQVCSACQMCYPTYRWGNSSCFSRLELVTPEGKHYNFLQLKLSSLINRKISLCYCYSLLTWLHRTRFCIPSSSLKRSSLWSSFIASQPWLQNWVQSNDFWPNQIVINYGGSKILLQMVGHLLISIMIKKTVSDLAKIYFDDGG